MTKKEQLIKIAKENLGKSLVPRNKELGCVEALANIFKQTFNEELGEDASTYWLYKKLQKDIRFEEVKEPEIGCLILSPTNYGNGKISGHIGIVGENKIIYSNNSATLLWDSHHTLESWNKRFRDIGGFPVLFYRLIEEIKEEEKVVLLQKQITLWEKIVAILKKLLK